MAQMIRRQSVMHTLERRITMNKKCDTCALGLHSAEKYRFSLDSNNGLRKQAQVPLRVVNSFDLVYCWVLIQETN